MEIGTSLNVKLIIVFLPVLAFSSYVRLKLFSISFYSVPVATFSSGGTDLAMQIIIIDEAAIIFLDSTMATP